jgi:V/A-type H+-transporting ATPase subunit I
MFTHRSESMKFMSLFMVKEDMPRASVILAESQSFDLSKANKSEPLLSEQYDQSYVKEFDMALGRFKKIVSFLKINLKPSVKHVEPVTLKSLSETNKRLEFIWNNCSSFDIRQRKLLEEKKFIHHLKSIWNTLAVFDTDMSLVDENLHFLDIRLGIIPSSHLVRLKNSLTLEDYHLSQHVQQGDNTLVIIAGMKEKNQKIQPLLDSANFKRIKIPQELYGQPDKINEKIQLMEQQHRAENLHYRQNLEIFRSRYVNELFKISDILTIAKPYKLINQQMKGKGALVNINGWVLSKQADNLAKQLNDNLNHKVIITVRDPHPSEYPDTPTQMRHGFLIAPFVALINNYGIPRYKEFDPSWFFALSYILMFGMMFGDIGHGLVFMLGSVFFYRRKTVIASFLLLIGLSSILFGFVYGSFFCYEHIVEPLWISPLSDPSQMLKTALFFGIGFVILLNLISIYNRLVANQLVNAMIDGQGVAGLLLFLGLLLVGYQFISASFYWYYWLLVIIPLLLIGINKWLNKTETQLEKLLIITIESYELIINYLANTISFLRLAAFSLNHVALAITVFTLADMVESNAHWFVIIFGNLFILILEGAVVGIQTLRLEYYEGFSRFFYADGYKFQPLNLSPKKLL